MKVLVVGSINVDFITISDNLPDKGETLIGREFQIAPGGKGANQAISIKKLGGNPGFFGIVGKDNLADIALENFRKLGIDTKHIRQSNSTTGVANILIEHGDNRIIVVSGANHDFSVKEFDMAVLDEYKILLLQLEINTDFVYWLIEKAYELGKTIILNPAPYDQGLKRNILEKVSYFTPNEIEAEHIFGKTFLESMKSYPNKMIVTLGEQGAIYYDGTGYISISAEKVKVLDTTGAGDTFNGAFAVAISENKNIKETVSFAVKAATKSVEKLGAQAAIPFRNDIV